jgi:hypothetical protein
MSKNNRTISTRIRCQLHFICPDLASRKGTSISKTSEVTWYWRDKIMILYTWQWVNWNICTVRRYLLLHLRLPSSRCYVYPLSPRQDVPSVWEYNKDTKMLNKQQTPDRWWSSISKISWGQQFLTVEDQNVKKFYISFERDTDVRRQYDNIGRYLKK